MMFDKHLSTVPHAIPRDAVVYIAGHCGLAGSAIWRYLQSLGFSRLVGRSSAELDLRERSAVFEFFRDVRPQYVVMAAARVGGIMANVREPARFLSDNVRIQVNVLDAAQTVNVRRLLFLGSSCIYPKDARQPIAEEALLTGVLEPTNSAYAIAKIAGVLHVQALRNQYGVSYICAMPSNLYGPNDNFDLRSAHVLPAMLRRFHDAKVGSMSNVTLWGTGHPFREFLHVDDLARACLFLLERFDGSTPINIGPGKDVSIRELANLIAATVGYQGNVVWDSSKPDGVSRKLLNIERISKLGWTPQIGLEEGVAGLYDWYANWIGSRCVTPHRNGCS